MNKYLKLFGILSLLCFSFYYTEQIAMFMQSKDPIYESIKAIEEEYRIDFVNANILNDTIIPGVYGQTVNIEKSFQNMKKIGFFREDALVFDESKPEVSLDEHKEKIIERGNPLKGGVSFILEEESLILYFEEMGLPYSVLTTQDTVNKKRNNGIKINATTRNYEEIEKTLKSKKENSFYCFLGVMEEDFCKSKEKLLIKETLRITKSNFLKTYNKFSSGSILYIEKDIGISNLKLLIESVIFRGLNIMSLDELLSESRY